MLNRKDSIQMEVLHGDKGRALLRGRDRELAIEFRDVLAPQEVIRLIDGLDVTDPEFLWQTAFPGAKASLTPAARLRRVGRDRLDSHVLQGPT